MQRLHQLGIPFCDITGMYLTHHHSDHVVGFPDLWLTGWIGRPWGKRSTPLDVWGPQGTRQMMEHLPQAFAVDLRVRSRSYPPEGAKLVPHEIKEGVVFDQDGIQVSAFEVDHGGEELPAEFVFTPDEVEFYLIDFKKGVEFKAYSDNQLPHVKAVAIESDREFGLSILQRLDAELSRRGELYRKAAVQDD